MITPKQLRIICPSLSGDRAELVAQAFTTALGYSSIDDPLELAMLTAQLAHESAEFRHFEEIADGAAYEGRLDLGNTHPGDGKKYKGRGPIQLTGRANYRLAAEALGLPLEAKPDLVLNPVIGFRVAVWYWRKKLCGGAARRGDLVAVTRKINGGLNGFYSRKQFFDRARIAFHLAIQGKA